MLLSDDISKTSLCFDQLNGEKTHRTTSEVENVRRHSVGPG